MRSLRAIKSHLHDLHVVKDKCTRCFIKNHIKFQQQSDTSDFGLRA